jgi:hypothetical protein
MPEGREGMWQPLQDAIERFRQYGATSPEKAMTAQELGLPARFEEAMRHRLGRSGIFVEVNGKYYLNEERLRQIREQRASGGYGGSRGYGSGRAGPPTWSRILGFVLILPIGVIIAILLFYFVALNGGFGPGQFLIVLLLILLVLTAIRLLFWRSRRRYWQGQY